MLNLLYILTGLAALSSTAALPTVSNDISLTPTPNTTAVDPLVTVTIYSESQCGGNNATYALDANVCYDFGDGVQALRVGVHNEALRYNSLHVYEKSGCASGPVLQPLNDACSEVVVYRSVKLDVPV